MLKIVYKFPKQITEIKAPPIKNQGIKTKLVKFIAENITWSGKGKWLEPFLGSGVLLFNLEPQRALVTDSNIHIIKFYKEIQSREITSEKVRAFLEKEGKTLLKNGEDYYYEVRKRFNETGSSYDFLFLNRACFNGVMRFNSKGKFNVPFCRKPKRFAKQYITKITNQVEWLSNLMESKKWKFEVMDWKKAVKEANENDFIYLDPPYFGRHTNYYDVWTEFDLIDLAKFLQNTKCGFALSLWYQNRYRKNEYVDKLFSDFTIKKYEHFYHVGSKESLRNSMTEALIVKPEI